MTAPLLEALTRHCPSLTTMTVLGVDPLTDIRERTAPRATRQQSLAFFLAHPQLRTWPSHVTECDLHLEDDDYRQIAQCCTKVQRLVHLRPISQHAATDIVLHMRDLRVLELHLHDALDDTCLGDASLVSTALRPPDAPRDWTPRMRPLQMLFLHSTHTVHVTDASLDAVARTCPRLERFEISGPASHHHPLHVSPAKILYLIRRCLQLVTCHLRAGPLAGVDRWSDDLESLATGRCPTGCRISFPVVADLSSEATRTDHLRCARHGSADMDATPRIRLMQLHMLPTLND
jgi:hypothetical protein